MATIFLTRSTFIQQIYINFFSMYMDKWQIPTKALQPNFVENDVDYLRTYMQMHSSFGTQFDNAENAISYRAFREESTVFVFDFIADLPNA